MAILAAGFGAAFGVRAGGTAPALKSAVTNGHFESGLGSWSKTGSVGVTKTAHSGHRAARVGGTANGKASSAIASTFVVPSYGGALRLWARDVCRGTIARDWAYATLKDNASGKTSTVMGRTCTNSGHWKQVSLNLDSLAGRHVTLTLANHDGGFGAHSFVLFDDVRVVPPNFSVAPARNAVNIARGRTVAVNIAVKRAAGSARGIKLSVVHLPAGITAVFSKPIVNAGGVSTLRLTASAAAAAVPNYVIVKGNSPLVTQTARLAVNVQPAGGGSTGNPTTPTGTAIACTGVNVTPATNLQSAINARAGNTTFCFAPGTYVLTGYVRPKSGDKLISKIARGAILTGQSKYNGGIVGSVGSGGEHDVLIEGFVVQRFVNQWTTFPRSAIQAGTNWTIRNNDVSYNTQAGITVNGGTKLLGNWIHHNGRYGFQGGPLSVLTITGNEISSNNTSHLDPGDDAGGFKIVGSSDGTTNVNISNNYVHDNYGNGIWCDWDCIGAKINGNLVTNNLQAGIFYEASFGSATINNNTLSGNCISSAGESLFHCAEIYLNDSQGVEMAGNSVTARTNGIGGFDVDRGSTPFGQLMICNNSMHDNTIKLGAGGENGFVSNRTNPCTKTVWATANNAVTR